MHLPQYRASLARHSDNNRRGTARLGSSLLRSPTTTTPSRPTLRTPTHSISPLCRRPPSLPRHPSSHRPLDRHPTRRSISVFPHSRRITHSRSNLELFLSALARADEPTYLPLPSPTPSPHLQNMRCDAMRLIVASFWGEGNRSHVCMERCDGCDIYPLLTCIACSLTLLY